MTPFKLYAICECGYYVKVKINKERTEVLFIHGGCPYSICPNCGEQCSTFSFMKAKEKVTKKFLGLIPIEYELTDMTEINLKSL